MPTLTQPETTQPQDEATADAWFAYLTTTRACSPGNYDEVEPHAWKQLKAKLDEAKEGLTQ